MLYWIQNYDFVCQQKGHSCTEDGCGESYGHRKYLKYHSESLYKNITEILRKGVKRFLYQSWPGQNSMYGRTLIFLYSRAHILQLRE